MEVKKFRKKPVEIEAVQYVEDADANDNSEAGVFPWLDSQNVSYDYEQIILPTLEGDMRASLLDPFATEIAERTLDAS